MPELPEVETVKNTLKKQILGKKIYRVDIFYDGIIATDVDLFKKNVIGEHFIDIKRRGKFLIFELDHYYLVSHLRMEGKYFIKPESDKKEKHEHVIFYLDDVTLRYHDTRKFGKMYLVSKANLYIETPLAHLGKEPWDDTLNSDYLLAQYHVNTPVKTLLLNQDILTGIGNIYADEILFMSHINPMKKGCNLTSGDCDNIINNTRKVLSSAIEMGGTTIRSYTSSLGVTGHFQGNLLVHNRVGEKCKECGSIIVKTKVNGRGTYYCPNCQNDLVNEEQVGEKCI